MGKSIRSKRKRADRTVLRKLYVHPIKATQQGKSTDGLMKTLSERKGSTISQLKNVLGVARIKKSSVSAKTIGTKNHGKNVMRTKKGSKKDGDEDDEESGGSDMEDDEDSDDERIAALPLPFDKPLDLHQHSHHMNAKAKRMTPLSGVVQKVKEQAAGGRTGSAPYKGSTKKMTWFK